MELYKVFPISDPSNVFQTYAEGLAEAKVIASRKLHLFPEQQDGELANPPAKN